MSYPYKQRIGVYLAIPVLLLLFHAKSFAQPEFPEPLILDVQTHEGDLVLSGTQELQLNNIHFIVSGNIIIRDRAKLLMRQSILEFSGHFSLLDSSYVKADTCILGGANASAGIDVAEAERMKGGILSADFHSWLEMNNCFSQTQFFMGKSTVRIKNSFLEQEPLGLVHAEGHCDVLIEDSRIGALHLEIPDETPIQIDSLLPGYLESWSIQEEISPQIPYQLVLKRTHLASNQKGYRGGMELGWNISLDAEKSDVRISNSVLNKIIIEFPQDEPAFFSDLRIRDAMTFDFNNIHISNTEVQTQWGFVMKGGYAEFINSEGLWISMMGGNADIIVHNSDVGEIDPFGYSGSLIFENSTWHSGYELWERTHINIRGTVRMLPTVPIFDSTSQMTRFYDLFVYSDEESAPFINMEMQLLKDGEVVWSGTTDMQGKVELSITYNKENSSDKWVLQTSDSTVFLNKSISIFDSNPLIINLEAIDGGIHYRNVIHVNNGADGFPNGTRMQPYPGIQEAIDNAGGSLIHVHPGTYNGSAEPGGANRTIGMMNYTSLLGSGPDSTIIKADIVAENARAASIRGFTLMGGVHSISSSIKLENNIISDSKTAVWGSNSHLELINNTIVKNRADAVFLHDSCSLILRNNIIVNNEGWGITGSEYAVSLIDYNNFWNNGGDYFEFFEPGTNDISEDPLFKNERDQNFRLEAGSPCIDRGDPNPVYNDHDGSSNDMGAFGGPGSFESGTSLPAFNPSYANGKIFPNPVTRVVSVHLPEGDLPATIDLYTIGGFLLNSIQMEGPLTEIDVAGYSPGVYLLSISSPYSSYTLKLVVY
jgi:parallel beta-helix repeat protein